MFMYIVSLLPIFFMATEVIATDPGQMTSLLTMAFIGNIMFNVSMLQNIFGEESLEFWDTANENFTEFRGLLL